MSYLSIVSMLATQDGPFKEKNSLVPAWKLGHSSTAAGYIYFTRLKTTRV